MHWLYLRWQWVWRSWYHQTKPSLIYIPSSSEQHWYFPPWLLVSQFPFLVSLSASYSHVLSCWSIYLQYYFFTKSGNYLFLDRPTFSFQKIIVPWHSSTMFLSTTYIIFFFVGLVMSLIGSLFTMLVVSFIQLICSCLLISTFY